MSAGVVIVQQYQRMVVQRFGTYVGLRRPGFHFLIPIVYNGTKVDLRERVAQSPDPEVHHLGQRGGGHGLRHLLPGDGGVGGEERCWRFRTSSWRL